MKYDININQRVIIEGGFGIDIVEAAIMDHCRCFSASSACQFKLENGNRYYWFEHKNICKQLPILGLKPDSAYRRMKKLCEKKFLSAHPQNRKLNTSWYAFGELADALVSTIGRKSEPSENYPKGGGGYHRKIIRTIGSKSEGTPPTIGRKSEGHRKIIRRTIGRKSDV